MIQVIDIESKPFETPSLVTIVGVNGVGKTTAIGKLAYRLKKEKKSVLMVAGDTFMPVSSRSDLEPTGSPVAI